MLAFPPALGVPLMVPDVDPPSEVDTPGELFVEVGFIRGSVTTIVLPFGEERTCDDELVLASDPGGRVTMICCWAPPV